MRSVTYKDFTLSTTNPDVFFEFLSDNVEFIKEQWEDFQMDMDSDLIKKSVAPHKEQTEIAE